MICLWLYFFQWNASHSRFPCFKIFEGNQRHYRIELQWNQIITYGIFLSKNDEYSVVAPYLICVINDSKLNIFGFWSVEQKKVTLSFKKIWWIFFCLFWHFYCQTINEGNSRQISLTTGERSSHAWGIKHIDSQTCLKNVTYQHSCKNRENSNIHFKVIQSDHVIANCARNLLQL